MMSGEQQSSAPTMVTVFGGAGFIGRHLIKRLAKTGTIIRVAVRNLDRALVLKPMGNVGQIVPMLVDINDPAGIEAALKGSDAVVNLIGILAESGGNRFRAVQEEAPTRIAEIAARLGVERLVHISAIGADPASRSAYARSKVGGEVGVRKHFAHATILRPSIVFGPEDQFFNRFAKMALLSPVLPLIGGGHTKFQPVYVGDVAAAIMAALIQISPRCQIYELGGPTIYSFRQLLTLMLQVIGRNRKFVSIPYPLAKLQAVFAGLLPNPPLTVDQVRLLQHDNIVAPGAKTLNDIGITATAAEIILPFYLDRFRTGGRFHRNPATDHP